MTESILLYTNTCDPESDAVAAALTAMGHTPMRLNTDEVLADTSLRYRFDGTTWRGGLTWHTDGREIGVDTISAVWVRRPHRYDLPTDLPPHQRAFARNEFDHALGGFFLGLTDTFWVSHPTRLRAAGWKTEQLQRAAAMGFTVPRTLVTTDPAAVSDFYDQCHGSMVYKSMVGSAGMQTDDPDAIGPELANHHLLTRRIGPAELRNLTRVRLAPCMFQEYVEKRHELRVTVIGDEVFAARIDSQAREETKVDWRHPGVPIRYAAEKLADETAARCVDFVRSYGLEYGAVDLIVTPEDDVVFLENNPSGNFLAIERAVPALRMTEALASLLVRGGGRG